MTERPSVGNFSNKVSRGIRYTVTPLTFSHGFSPVPRNAMTLTLTPFATRVAASLRTRVSLGNRFSTSIKTLPADAFICLSIPTRSDAADKIDDMASVHRVDQTIL